MKISIVIPVYNVQAYIEKTVLSILTQNNPNIEIIVVNDGSIDNSCNVIKSLISKHMASNIKVITQENQGVSIARNVGLENSSGEYIYFLDGDDYVTPDYIFEILNIIETQSPDVLFWQYKSVNEQGRLIGKLKDTTATVHFESGLDVLSNIVKNNEKVWIGATLFNRNLIESNNLRFTPRCFAGEDVEFVYKALMHAKIVIRSNKSLTYYLQRKGSATNSYNVRRFDAVQAKERISQYYDVNVGNSGCLANILRGFIVSHYLVVHKSCMHELLKQSNNNFKTANKKIISDINNIYPNMNIKIRSYLKYCKIFGLVKNIKIHLFFVSPNIYYGLFPINLK